MFFSLQTANVRHFCTLFAVFYTFVIIKNSIMKRTLIITAVLLTVAALFASFKSRNNIGNNNYQSPDNYQAMWQTFQKNFEDDLPESAGKVLDDIEKLAEKENNQPQLLKAILYRRKVMHFTVEDYTDDVYIAYAIEQLPRLEAVPKAILHEEIARIYSSYMQSNRYRIVENHAIDGDLSKVQMKYWDKQSFLDRIDVHHTEALKPLEELKQTPLSLYLGLFENGVSSSWKTYEPTMFEFMLHRVSGYYREQASADDLEPDVNTALWWLKAPEFVKADLGQHDKPLYKCLKLYQSLLDYNLKNNPKAAIFNDYKRYEFVNGILKDNNQYHQNLQRLIDENPGNEECVDLTVILAQSLIRQYEENSSDSAYFDNYRKAYDLCQRTMTAFPDSKYQINNIVNDIKDSMLQLRVVGIQLPNEPIPAVVNYRNTERFRYKVVHITEAKLQKFENVYYDKRIEFLNKLETVAEEVVTLPQETDFRAHNALIALPKLKSGIYFLMACCSETGEMDYSNTKFTMFQVSPLGFIMDTQSDRLNIMTVNRKTGHPVAGVEVELSRKVYNDKTREYERKLFKTLTSDQNGMVVCDNSLGITSLFDVTLRKDDDLLLPTGDYSIPKESKSTPYYTTELLADRAIYRPGQTIYFKGIVAYNADGQRTLAANVNETVILKDANWQEVTRASFTTDEFGGFSGSFVIPDNRLNGVFHLDGVHGDLHFRVEEYKRPTFEISFEHVKEQYKLNHPVTVQGSVDALAGFALDDVQYTYSVVRKTHFPWRCWWWWYPVVEDEQIDHGEGRTDADGKFAITFNLKPSLKTRPQQQPVFYYEVEVTATSAQGETHSDIFIIRAGYNEVALSTDVPSLVDQNGLDKCKVYVTNMSGEPAKSRVARKIYRFDDAPKINYYDAFYRDVTIDRQLLSDEELKTLFPAYCFETNADRMKHKTLVCQDKIDINDNAPFSIGKQTLKPGKYYIELTSLDDTLAVTAKEFTVYNRRSDKLPSSTLNWIEADKTTAHPGETVRFRVGSSATDAQMWVQLMRGKEILMERHVQLNNNIVEFSYTVKEEDRDGLLLKTAIVKDNYFQMRTKWVSVPYDNLDLNVSLATMRDKLTPGSEETWTVSVKDYKDKPATASLVAGMYDVSLDVFSRNSWSFDLRPNNDYGTAFSTAKARLVSVFFSPDYWSRVDAFEFTLPSAKSFFGMYSHYDMLGGRLYKRGAIVEDVVEEMAMAPNAAGAAKLAMVEDDAEAEIASEEMAADEGKVDQKEPAKEEEPALRENFNETAFFFPNLRTEADGTSTFSFTMPDAITRWRLMMLAFNNQGQTGYKEYEFKASKPVMIMADMPRYLYDTDTMWFVANVINTGDEKVTPKAKLEIFDAVTMKPLDLLLSDAVINMNEIVPGRSQEVRWKVAAKYDLSLIALRFTAYAGQFSDAEQHLLPVLSSEIFLTQTLPVTVKAETEQTFDFDAIANPNSRERDYALTLNFSTNPVWYAVQALPSLANVSTKRPETAFYVFYANTLSAHIANNIPNLMAYIKKWQIETPDALMSQLEKDQDLKAILLQETPWVLEAKSESEQRSRIATLFEVNNLRRQQTETLNLLEKTQMYGGGWPWFEGMPESSFITSFILGGFGKLKNMGAWTFMNNSDQRKAERICEKAVKYLEYHVAEVYREMMHHHEDWGIGSGIMDNLYALSFFKEQNSDKDFAKAKAYFLEHLGEKKEWRQFDFGDRAEAAMVLYRNDDVKTAKAIIASFKECAMKNDQIGMYWPKRYFSWVSHIATHAQIMTAFAEIDQDQETLDKLKVWLLTQKQTTMWENSASTAEACYALLMRGSDWLDDGEKQVTLRFADTPISTEGGVAGTGFIQRHWNANEVTEDMRHLTVNNPTGHLVWGGLFRQYFVPIDEVKSDESGFKISRELFVETVTDKGKLLVPVDKRTLHVGDKVTVKITFESPQDMSFVFVKDLRAAGFEPIEQLSKYEYHDGMRYYQSNTDTDMEFFIDFLTKGVHQLEYSMFVTKEGNLSNGYAQIQCQYAPEFSAYSDGMRVRVGNEE